MSSKKIVLKKLKELDTIWHPESTLVFKSSKDKIVIGRYENEKFVSLDDICLKLCETWKFKYDSDLIETEEVDEEVDEEVEETEEVKEKEETDEDDFEEVTKPVDLKEELSETESVEDVDDNILTEKTPDEIKQVSNVFPDVITVNNICISDITTEYSSKLHGFFDLLSQNYNTQLLNLKNEVSKLGKINENLQRDLDSEKENHINTTEKLAKLQTKFDGIKQLFSL